VKSSKIRSGDDWISMLWTTGETSCMVSFTNPPLRWP
jgi:hypothetical protein